MRTEPSSPGGVARSSSLAGVLVAGVVECGLRLLRSPEDEEGAVAEEGESGGEGVRLVERDLERKESRRLSEFILGEA